MPLPGSAPHTWVANDDATSGNLQSMTAWLDFLRNRSLTVLRQTVQQSIPNASWTALNWDTVGIDVDTLHTGTSSQLIPPIPGWWALVADAATASNATGQRGLRPVKNGSALFGRDFGPPASGFSTGLHYACEIDFNGSTDYVEVQVYQSSGGALLTGGSTEDPGRISLKYLRPL
ncbi:MAG: hypothetical protein M3N21_08610 [Actinomycetota bacterium]|nr:hypothetical protein [Actinomycetota bacterium]